MKTMYRKLEDYPDCTLFKRVDEDVYTLRDREGDVLMMGYSVAALPNLQQYGARYSLADVHRQKEDIEAEWRRMHCI